MDAESSQSVLVVDAIKRKLSMPLLVYANSRESRGDDLLKEIGRVVRSDAIEHVTKLRDLKLKLRRVTPNLEVVVLLAANHEELQAFLGNRDLYHGHKIVLILPDSDAKTISTGHKLCPRFLTQIDSDFKNTAAVVEKMMENAAKLSWSGRGQRIKECLVRKN